MLCPTRVRQFLLVVSILITFTKTTVAQTAPCTSLIATNGNVKFSASTSSLGPGYPYLNSSHVWCAGVINDEQYLQVDFGFVLFLDRLSVQGHGGSNRSASQYYVETSNDNINYQEVVETPGGATKTFYGPMFDGDKVVSQNLSTPIQARYVRFSPQEPTPRNFNYLCMRVDVLSCQNVLAPINGNLSQWSAWSTCPADCSRRVTSRTRTCTNPAPAFGGSKCTGGHKREDQFCNVPCTEPLDGGWSPWSGYSFCTVSCNGGFQIRSRTCSQPFPERGGRDCQGHRIERRSCNTHPCPTTQPPVVTTPTSQPATTYHESRNHTESENHTESGNYTEMYTTAAATTTELPSTTASQGGQIEVPYIDLVFAVSATSNNSNQTYALMQNTIKRFIDLYGADKIHYSVIAFGDAVARVVDFNHTFPPTANELKAAIDVQSPLAGGPVLVDALGETLRIFNETKTRPNARKVLVVMTDENSGADEETLATSVRPLEDDNILVISVATGAANRSELLIISPNPLDVISADDNQDSIGLARHIMDRILRKIPEIDVGFAITAASVSSRVIFNLKLQTIQAINERYQGHKVSFSVIVYGSRRTTRLTFDSSSTNHETLIADVNHIDEVSGPVDLKKALMEAEQLFRSLGRPSAKKVFVVLTDSGNDNEIIAAGDILRRHGVILLSVDHTGDQFNSVKITHIDYLGIPTVITDRPVVVAETIIYKALQVNIPEIDLTFAISATSVQSEDTVDLMRRTIQSIILQYGIDRIHYSVIYFGSVAATRFDFSNAPPDQDEMIRQVGRLPKRDGLPSPDLVEPLNEAKRIYELQEVRPNARRVLVVIMDNSSVSNEDKLKEAVNALVNNSVFIIGVGIGPNINRRDLILITRELPHVLVVTINKSPQELAEEIMEIIDLGIRTAGFSRWGWWSTCSKTCLSFGVPGTQSRTRVCERPRLGCQGATVETRECNTENCQGCQEREPPSEESYQASTAIQPARLARLNTSNPSASQLAWCRDTEDAGGFVQIDLGEQVLISRIATKGQEMLNAARWVMTFYVSLSPDGLTYSDYQEGGERKDFLGNDDPFNIIFHNLSSSGPIQYIRFHPITYQEQPCMQASVFGCPANIGPVVNRISDISGAGTGILLALWILAGILSFLLLMACCYYCCWHVCCGRGKKRKGLAASYLIEDDVDNRWILMPPFMASRLKPVAESEIQEVTVEIAEETPKVSGVISFGIEAEETKEKFVTAEGVHSETPVYSEDGVAVTSNASTLSMGSSATGSQTSERRKRIKSEAAASASSAESSRQSSFKSDSLGGSGIYNKGYLGSVEWLNEPAPSPSQKRGSRKRDLTRSQSVDELATVDFGMFENHRGSTQAVEMGRDGYMRMQQTSGERVDVPVAPQANVASDKHQMYSTEEQVLTFMTEGGDPNNMRILEDWMTGRAGERGNTNGPKEPLYSQVGAEIRSENDPTYAVVGSQIKAENGPTYSVVGSQIKAAENDPTYSEVGSQIKADDDPIYSEVGSQI